MAAVGKVTITVTPEIQEAINILRPVAETSRQLLTCLCEFEDEPIGEAACSEYRELWERAVLAYQEYRARKVTT